MLQEGTCAGADSSESTRKTGTFASAVKKISTTFRWFYLVSDAELFSVAAPSNPQNDRLYAQSSLKKRDVDPSRLLRTRPTFSKSVMVSVAVSAMGCSHIHFLEPGVKVNGEYYRNVVLMDMLLRISVLFLVTASCFNRTAHLLTEHMTQSSCCAHRHRISYHPTYGLWTHRT